MQPNNDQEDEKSPDPFLIDDRLYDITRKVLEQKSEDLIKALSSQFIDHILQSHSLPGVSCNEVMMILATERKAEGAHAVLLLRIP
jgi:hypothetical protein